MSASGALPPGAWCCGGGTLTRWCDANQALTQIERVLSERRKRGDRPARLSADGKAKLSGRLPRRSSRHQADPKRTARHPGYFPLPAQPIWTSSRSWSQIKFSEMAETIDAAPHGRFRGSPQERAGGPGQSRHGQDPHGHQRDAPRFVPDSGNPLGAAKGEGAGDAVAIRVRRHSVFDPGARWLGRASIRPCNRAK